MTHAQVGVSLHYIERVDRGDGDTGIRGAGEGGKGGGGWGKRGRGTGEEGVGNGKFWGGAYTKICCILPILL